jgi:tetratricopeptide (TPR) repeat protein
MPRCRRRGARPARRSALARSPLPLAVALMLLGAACTVRRPRALEPDAAPPAPPPLRLELPAQPPTPPCPVADPEDLDAALDEAVARAERGDPLIALACAERAARISPRSVEAHHARADALVALGRAAAARDAFTLALALDPDDPQTLASAADLYINRLGSARELLQIGAEYARRGSAHVGRRRDDRELSGRLALLEAEALDELGRADEALPRVEAALRYAPESVEVRYLRAVILFHLCRLDRARAAFEDVLRRAPDDAYAHHHLGLLLERDGHPEAETHFARARALAPGQFTTPVLPTVAEFEAMVARAVAGLDPAARSLVELVRIELADLPELADLRAADPPFPPTILGLFRSQDERRAIVLFRKNLARAAATPEELERQVGITLLHELGHVAGADEDELRARGIE